MKPFQIIIDVKDNGQSNLDIKDQESLRNPILIRNILWSNFKEFDYICNMKATESYLAMKRKISNNVLNDPVIQKLSKRK